MSVTRPYFCVCTQRGRVGYPGPGAAPGCTLCRAGKRDGDAAACAAGCCDGIESRFSMRSARQALMFGPETYQGHYGDAFKLRFPDYTGPVYTAQIALDHCVPYADVASGKPLVLVGDSYYPYFRVYRAPSNVCPQPASAAAAPRAPCGCGGPC